MGSFPLLLARPIQPQPIGTSIVPNGFLVTMTFGQTRPFLRNEVFAQTSQNHFQQLPSSSLLSQAFGERRSQWGTSEPALEWGGVGVGGSTKLITKPSRGCWQQIWIGEKRKENKWLLKDALLERPQRRIIQPTDPFLSNGQFSLEKDQVSGPSIQTLANLIQRLVKCKQSLVKSPGG